MAAASVVASKMVGLPKKMVFNQPEVPTDLQKNFELKNGKGKLKSSSLRRDYTPQAVTTDAPTQVILFIFRPKLKYEILDLEWYRMGDACIFFYI